MQEKKIEKEKIVNGFRDFSNKYGIILVLLLLVVICSLLTPVFATKNNVLNILRQICVYALLAAAEGTLIISGSIDLSAGSTVCLCGIVSIPIYIATGSTVITILMTILFGMALYAVTGVMVSVLKLPAFVATLAMQMAVRGAAKLYTGGMVITQTGEGFTTMGQGYLFGIPNSVYVMLLGIFILWITWSKTRYGRNLFAIGGNPEAARASGINVNLYRFYSFLNAGAFVGLAGFMLASRLNNGNPAVGQGYEGQGISAAIIGGVGFAGGTGSAGGVLVGALIIGVISNILNLMRVDSYLQEVINGLIIVAAVALDLQTKKKKVGK